MEERDYDQLSVAFYSSDSSIEFVAQNELSTKTFTCRHGQLWDARSIAVLLRRQSQNRKLKTQLSQPTLSAQIVLKTVSHWISDYIVLFACSQHFQ